MKTAFLLLSLLFLAFGTKLSPVKADASPPAVRDTAGHKLSSGVKYYIFPANPKKGGGFTFEATNNGKCPFGVVQDNNKLSKGLPVRFFPVNPKMDTIRVSTDHNIKFAIPISHPPSSSVWKVGEYSKWIGKQLVTTCGVLGNPGRDTLSSWFKIEKYDDDYKLVFCPSVCKSCKVFCKGVGIFIKDGVHHLALTDNPLKIMFKKA
ncbi:PREDICTED: miraculin-like [Nelumbo nucifera]|uniref:Miraculin-like n=2 Tax=Nelumbo nucifera TaxID=4432 RepID=A0A1U8BPL6_NELNU|nr:PREDICTED: miraculin-like [Nelumbo nucifera]DAD32809.1 TPA_asm: hypothetical protein HUJ06_011660 [Nelumbo nucifera]